MTDLPEPATAAGAEPDWPIVALVCSRGGLDALSVVIGGLPADFPGAVIVLRHQSPDAPSPLAHILASRGALPVSIAENHQPLVPGTVIVVPQRKHLLVAHDEAVLIDSDGPPPNRPSADLLLTSLALTVARRSIAVILSGDGHDGATGATALHDFGGIVVASDEASSEYFGMPGAGIDRDDVVDYAVPLARIPELLCSLAASGRRAPRSERRAPSLVDDA